MLCCQHGYTWPSLPTSPYHSSPPAGLLDYILYPHIVAVCKFELVVLLLHGHMWGSIGVHHLWPSSLLLQQCPACLVRLTCIVFMMGASVCIVGVSWYVVAKTRSILLSTFLCSFRLVSSPSHLVSVHVVHPYCIDTTTAWKKLRFILSLRSDFHMIESLLIAVHAFISHVLMSFSVDEMLLPINKGIYQA